MQQHPRRPRLPANLLLGVCLLLAACAAPQPAPAVEAQPMMTETPSPSPSPSVVWFPPTATFTPVVTLAPSPTPERRPGVGEVILSDSMNAPGKWLTTRNAAGSIQFGKYELTLAVSSPKGSLASQRSATYLSDFYLEVIASPSLCRDNDSYGLQLRAASYQDYYRFSVNCRGMTRLERVRGATPAVLQDWTFSGQVPPGAPAVLRLGVWALGRELRFFINDEFLYAVTDVVRGEDISLRGGTLGVFARAAGDSAVTVNFTQLEVRAVAPQSLSTPVPGG